MSLSKSEEYGLRVKLAEAMGIKESEIDNYTLVLQKKNRAPVDLQAKSETAVSRLIDEFTRKFTEYEYQQGVKKSWVTREAGQNPEIIIKWLGEKLAQ